MKFAHSHLRSKYSTAKLFHMAKPYFTRRRRISLKKAHIVLVDKCVLFFCLKRNKRSKIEVKANKRSTEIKQFCDLINMHGLLLYLKAFAEKFVCLGTIDNFEKVFVICISENNIRISHHAVAISRNTERIAKCNFCCFYYINS